MKRKPIRWQDTGLGKNNYVERPHRQQGYYAEMGRSYTYIACPFCERRSRAFIWSLSGGGKRCENTACQALHGSHGRSYQWADKIPETAENKSETG